MKRLLVSCALLLFLLLGCLFNAWYIHDLTHEAADLLEQAQDQTLEGNWDNALVLTHQVQKSWQDRDFYLRVFLSHRDVDQIIRGLAQAEADLMHQNMDQYAPTNRDITTQLRILGDMELPRLANIL